MTEIEENEARRAALDAAVAALTQRCPRATRTPREARTDSAAFAIDGREWFTHAWFARLSMSHTMSPSTARFSSHDPHDFDVIRCITLPALPAPAGAAEGVEWEVSKKLEDGVYARVCGVATDFEVALGDVLRAQIVPDSRDGVKWYSDRDGFFSVDCGSENLTVAPTGSSASAHAWRWSCSVKGDALIAALAGFKNIGVANEYRLC